MNKKRKKRPVTLIEIMIVILLIGLIGGALAYNMTGSLDEGRAFKTRQNKEKLHDILMYEHLETGKTLQEIKDNPGSVIINCALLTRKQRTDILKDGWNQDFEISIVDDDFVINSPKLISYESKSTKR